MKFAVIVLLAGLVLAGCKKEEATISDSGLHRKLSEVPQSDEEIILGDSINDPYRIDNMRAAYNALVNEGITPNVPSIEPNYRYVKILPDNEAGLDNLEADTNLLLFDYIVNLEPDYYTPVFADLIDNYNQRDSSIMYPNDMISGYSILEIQNLILGNTTNLASLKSTLKANKRHGTTNSQIDSLLVLYYNMSMF